MENYNYTIYTNVSTIGVISTYVGIINQTYQFVSQVGTYNYYATFSTV